MKKLLWLLVVVGLVCLWFPTFSQAQEIRHKGFKGTLLRYDIESRCTGTTYVDGPGHVVQYSTNGGSTWIDGPTTDSNGYYEYTPNLAGQPTVHVRGKPMCVVGSDHLHNPCNSGSYDHDSSYPYLHDFGTEIKTTKCVSPEGPGGK